MPINIFKRSEFSTVTKFFICRPREIPHRVKICPHVMNKRPLSKLHIVHRVAKIASALETTQVQKPPETMHKRRYGSLLKFIGLNAKVCFSIWLQMVS